MASFGVIIKSNKLGDFASSRIYPQIKPVLNQIEDMTDLDFATKIDRQIINVLKEYLKAHPGITLPVPNDVEGNFSWRQSF